MKPLLISPLLLLVIFGSTPGFTKTPTYDCDILQRAARASRAAYELYEQANPRDPKLIATFSGTSRIGGFAILRQNNNKGWCELAFKGTDITDPEDILLNLAATIPVQCGRKRIDALGTCAAGFFVQYLSIRNENRLFSALQKIRELAGALPEGT